MTRLNVTIDHLVVSGRTAAHDAGGVAAAIEKALGRIVAESGLPRDTVARRIGSLSLPAGGGSEDDIARALYEALGRTR